MQNEEYHEDVTLGDEVPQDLPLPPEPPVGLRVYQDERGEVLSVRNRNWISALFLCVWLVFWWIGIAVQLRTLLTAPEPPIGWLFFALFCVPGVIVPFVVLGMIFGAQELCFRFDEEITFCQRRACLHFSKKSFYPNDIQRLSIGQAMALTKNRNHANHALAASVLNIGLPEETVQVVFRNDPDQAIARYCAARIRATQRTF